VRRRTGLRLLLLAGLLALAPMAPGGAAAVAAGEGQYLVHDYGTAMRVRNILPSGEQGTTTLPQFIQGTLDPTFHPPHQYDQRAMYDGPTFVAPGQVTEAQRLQFSKEETFGVPDDQIESVESPRPGLTIVRDKGFGVPHIFAATKPLAKFAAGWVSAEDRMFMMDVLRHAGRGNLSSLVGASGFGSDCDTHYGTGYDQADANYQEGLLDPRVLQDAHDFADGINAYVQSPGFVQNLPVEYTGIFPPPVGANAWTVEDTGAVAALIGSQLGGGGGAEVGNTLAYEKLVTTYGATEAQKIFDDLHAANDPESPTTIDQSFPYESRGQRDPASVALIDGGPADPNGCTHTPGLVPPLPGPLAASAAVGRAAPSADREAIKAAAINRALAAVATVRAGFPNQMSNAIVVNASHSVDGHPIAVFGPQAAYFQPQIFMEMDVHAPGWDARGFQFPGTGVVVELGRGQDFAWSATSAGSDNIDQRVELLCNPANSNPLQGVAANSTFYYYKGQCRPMQELAPLQYVVPPSPGTLPPGFVGTETFTRERTVHDDGVAIVQGRTTALFNGNHVPVAISLQRTNFLHELEQAAGFEDWNDPGIVHDARSFITAASKVDTTFNWFYVDGKDTAYYTSGKLPVRNPAANPDLLNWATGQWDWQGWLPASQHPQAINPARGWMTSWNNRPAPNFGSSDSNWDYGSLYRSQLLDRELTNHLAAGGGKVTLLDAFNSMQAASITDHRAQRLVGELDAVIGTLSPSEQTTYGAALAAVNSWHASGDRRQSPSDGAPYAHADGISLFDAWYPHLVKAIYDPWLDPNKPDNLCDPANNSLGGIPKTFDNPPNDGHCYGGFSGFNVGSSFDGGWQDAIDKDLRQVLGRSVAGPHQHLYCGGASGGGTPIEGSLVECRKALLAALNKGISDHQANFSTLTAGDRMDYRALGLQGLPTEQWSNKPTAQQFVEFLTTAEDANRAGGPGSLPNTSTIGPGLALGVALGLLALSMLPRRRRRRGSAGGRT
jgi:acyl-homoserine lactone acylase PvdQ